jgi:hypothetical protein
MRITAAVTKGESQTQAGSHTWGRQGLSHTTDGEWNESGKYHLRTHCLRIQDCLSKVEPYCVTEQLIDTLQGALRSSHARLEPRHCPTTLHQEVQDCRSVIVVLLKQLYEIIFMTSCCTVAYLCY